MTGREIIEALRCGRQGCICSKGRITHCPAHGDRNPSLSITESNGKTLFHCHTGCAQEAVIAALKERGLWGAESSAPTPIRSGRGRLTVSYEFRDADGNVVAEHGRFENATGKSFAWRLPGGSWDAGLGSLPITALPLYGLQRLQDDPSAPVWVVEGEKASDRAHEAGLIAVSLGGGAAQQSFGNTLDPLRDRDVILWPDNDDAGAAFMGRLAGLLPQARYVRPVMPPKGDAYDYFEAGGTVSALLELLQENGPFVQVMADDAVTVTLVIPSGRVRFEFSGMEARSREVNAELRIVVDVPTKRRTPFSRRLNLKSSSGVNGLRLELDSLFGKEMGWAPLLSEACDLARETWTGIDRSVDLVDVALPEERRWMVKDFAPEGVVTIPFGMGGSCKSYILADIALCCLYGMPWMGHDTQTVDSVLVVDYEDREDEWRRRVQDICDGHGWMFPERGYRYLSGNAIPLADQLVQLREIVSEHGVGLVVVDSAVSACGDDLKDANSPSRLINALTALGVTSLVIAHNTKAEDTQYPYGSIFFHQLARATHYIEANQEEGANVVDVVIWNRKGNRGKKKPIPLRVTFQPDGREGPVTIDMTASIPASLQPAAQSARWQILECMKEHGRPMSARQIGEATGLPEKTVGAELSRNKRWFTSPSRGVWALLDDRLEASAQ